MVEKICEVCCSLFKVIKTRENTAKYCSKACSVLSKVGENNTECSNCGKAFHMKPSQKARYKRSLGYFCSVVCSGTFKSTAYLDTRNPNNKSRNVDCDGYRIFSPQSSMLLGRKKQKLHIAIACAMLGVDGIPKGFHVHHRDCDILNNMPENLCVLSTSDHVWLHKQFGNATLWAFMCGKVELSSLCSWSDDPDRAERLLCLNVTIQTLDEIGVVKGGELLENPEEDNQQPSLDGNIFEGSETSGRVVASKFADSNSTTSALHLILGDDIVRTACITKEDAERVDKEPHG